MRKLIIILMLSILSFNAFAVMAVIDAANAKINTLKKTELVLQTKELVKQGKVMVDEAKTLKEQFGFVKKQYNAVVDKVEDVQEYYARAESLMNSSKRYYELLRANKLIKRRGWKFDFKDPMYILDETEALYTDVADDPVLARFAQQLRQQQKNEYAKAGIAHASMIIAKQEDRAKDIEKLTRHFEGAETIAEKQTVENEILLKILEQMQAMAQLQAELNRVILAEKAEALKELDTKKWGMRDWQNHYRKGGGDSRNRLSTEELKAEKEFGL